MATTTIKIMTLANLQKYDPKIKEWVQNKINTSEAKNLKAVAISGNTLKFYKAENPGVDTVADFSIDLPETDLSNLLEKFNGATAGDVVTIAADGKTIADSGVKLADLATKSEVSAVDTKVDNLTNGAVKDNTDAIAVLNGTEAQAGSVKKAVKDLKDALDVDIAAAKKAGDDAQADVNALKPIVTKLNGDENTDGSVKKLVKDAKDALQGEIGTLGDLSTTAKDNLVNAVNEVKGAVDSAKTAGAVTIETTPVSAGALKSYIIKQGGVVVSTIDIPKDMVVQSGEVVKDPAGQAAGTYIKLVLANVDEPLYINVGTLVDIYKAKASATQVQVAIDSSTREISATIVAGSIGTTELADSAVTTAKIADANVTKAKLATDVQTSLDKADSAVQSVVAGTANGTIAVDGTDVKVTGLDSAAYAKTTDFDAAGAAADAETNAKNHADGLNTAMDARVAALESVSYVELTDDEINALFA